MKPFSCWFCGKATSEPPCDGDSTGETGMVWPPVCYQHIDNHVPVRLDAFAAKCPNTIVPRGQATTEFGLTNQAYYRICRERGSSPWQRAAGKVKASA